MNLDLSGQTALVTGGGTGIGLGIARALLDQGAMVVLASRTRETLEQARAELNAGARCHVEALDITDAKACSDLVRAIGKAEGSAAAAGGRLDILVHNAGTDMLMPLDIAKVEAIDAMVRTNVYGALVLSRAAIPLMGRNKAGGAIVSVSSSAGLRGARGRVVYSATKAALHGMTRSLALELAPRRIRVNAVAPGVVNTAMHARAMAKLNEAQIKAIEASHPLGTGDVTDVASLVGFLVSPAARWITGQVIAIDGGLTT